MSSHTSPMGAMPTANVGADSCSLSKAKSSTACVKNVSYGCFGPTEDHAMWVDRGCRGDFLLHAPASTHGRADYRLTTVRCGRFGGPAMQRCGRPNISPGCTEHPVQAMCDSAPPACNDTRCTDNMSAMVARLAHEQRSSVHDCTAASSAAPCAHDAVVSGGEYAIAFDYRDLNGTPRHYGHVWPVLLAVWASLLRVRLQHGRDGGPAGPLPLLRLVFPAGPHLGRDGQRFFEELEVLFSGCAGAALAIERAPWVPYCGPRERILAHRRPSGNFDLALCHAAGPPPARRLSHQLLAFSPKLVGLKGGSSDWAAFRDDARRCTRAESTKLVTWVLASTGSNQRRIGDEHALIRRAQRVVRERPGWHLQTVNLERMSFSAEAAAVSSSSILISLFGSALYNCRLMAKGSVVVEIHAALKFDFASSYFYRDICNRESLGLDWVAYAPAGWGPEPWRRTRGRPCCRPGALAGGLQLMRCQNASNGLHPGDWCWERLERQRTTFETASVDPDAFEVFLSRVVRGELAGPRAEYDRVIDGHNNHVRQRARGGGQPAAPRRTRTTRRLKMQLVRRRRSQTSLGELEL